MTALDYALEVDGEQTVIRLVGDLDIAAVPDLIILANAAVIRPDMKALVIDLSGVRFLDSSGIGALVRARNLCARHDADLRLRGVGPRAGKVLEITGLAQGIRACWR